MNPLSRVCRYSLIGLLFLTGLVPGAHTVAADCSSAPEALVSWWPGDGTANDIAGANNGALHGGATASAAGVVGAAFSFDGTTGYVQIPDSPALKPTNLTIEAWVSFAGLDSAISGNAPAGDQYIVFKQNSRTYYFEGYSLEKYRIANGDVFMFTVGSASGQEMILLSKTLISTSVWYHVAAVRGSNYTELYVNGQLESRTNVSFVQDYGSLPLYFGTSGQTFWDGKLRGLLDEVSLYNRALSSNEVAAVYAAGAAGKCKAAGITAQPQGQAAVIGDDVTFTVTATGFGVLSYQWRYNGGSIAGATRSSLGLGNVQLSNAGSYTVVVTNSLGAATSAVAVLTVVCPSVTLSPSSLADGTAGVAYSQSLSASGGFGPYTFAMTGGTLPSGLSLSSGGVLSGIPGAIGTNSFTVTATDTNGCWGSLGYSLVVTGGPPLIVVGPQSRTNVIGTDATFNVTATGTSPLVYQWEFNGVAIAGATGSSLVRGGVDFGDGGGYRVVVTNVAGVVTSSVATLTVVCPVVSVSPGSLPTGLVGSSYSQTLTASGGFGPYTFAVSEGTLPAGLDLSSGGVLSGIPGAIGTSDFTVRATDTNGCWGSRGYSLVVTATPPLIVVGPESRTNVAGTAATFSAIATGTPPLSYQWRFNGADLTDGGLVTGAITSTLGITFVQPDDAGSYTLVVSNMAGVVTSTVATLTVVVPVTCVAPADGVISWWPGDGNGNDVVGMNSGMLQGGATANAVGLVDSAFSFDGTSGYVQIPDAPALKPTNLTVEAWVRFGSLDTTGTAAAGQQYIVFKQNSRTYGFEAYDLGKSRSGGQDFFVFRTSSADGTAAAVYSSTLVTTGVWYHVAGVRGSNYLQLYVNGQLQSQTNVSFAQDYGTTPLYFGTSGQAYWDRKFAGNLDEVALYSRALSSNEVAAIYGMGAGGKCKGARIAVQPPSQGVVMGSDVTFGVTATGFGVLSYQWRYNGGSIAGATGTSLGLSNVQPSDAGSYTVVVTNSLGAVTSAVAVLTVWVPPAITAQPQSRTNILGTDASFGVAAAGSAPLNYQWEFNGVAVAGATGSNLVRSGVGFEDGGGYRVVVTNVAGVVTSEVATLTVVCPSVTLSPSSLPNGALGVTYSQSLSASGGFGLYTFAVTEGTLPSGLSLSSSGVLSGIPSAIETSSFTVTATDANGCSGSHAYILAITGGAPIITGQPASQAAVVGMNVVFLVTASGTGPLSYQWVFNGTSLVDGGQISGSTSASLYLSNVQLTNAGNYAVVVTSPGGAVTSAVAVLTVDLPASCVAAADGLVAWWPGEGNPDDTVNGNDGFLQGGATAAAAGRIGSAFGFDGTNGYVSIPDTPELRPANLTVEAWVRFESLDSPTSGNSPVGQQYIVFKESTHLEAFEGYALTKARVGGEDVFDFAVSSAAGQTVELTGQTLVVTGVWYHVAGVRGDNRLQLYVNGQLEDEANVNFPQDYGDYPLYFGTSGQPTWDHKLAGTLDEVSLYNRALSASEIAAIYTAGAEGKCKAVTITVQPQSHAAAVGSDVTFSVTALGSSPLMYQWQRNGVNMTNGGNVAGVSFPVLSLANVALADSASYRVIVTNPLGAATSEVAVLHVSPTLTPPSITSQPASQTATAGTSVNFTVAASGSAPLGYQWLFNGAGVTDGWQFDGTTTPTLTIGYALPTDSGAYSVVVTNDVGAVTSAVATLTVSVPTECLTPPAGLVGWWPGDGSAQDIVGTNNGTLEGGATANAAAVVGTGFSLDGTNMYVQIPDSPVLKPAELTVECWVRWNDLNTPGTSVYPGQQYIVFKQNSRMTDFEGYVLSKDRTWDDIILWEVTSASGQLVRIDSTSPVTTNVWYHLAAVRGSNYIQLYFNGRLESQANVDFPQDYGNWPLYFGTSGQSYYDRKLNGVIDEVALYNRVLSPDEIATLYAVGAAGKCKGTNGLLITAQPESQVVPPGSSTAFSVSAVGANPIIYQWEFNGAVIPDGTNSILALPAVQGTNAGTYKAVITNPTGTKTSAEAILVVASSSVLSDPRMTAGGAFALTLSGLTGAVYTIEVTTNLQQWAPLTSLTNLTGQTDFTDMSSSNSFTRFYRARLVE